MVFVHLQSIDYMWITLQSSLLTMFLTLYIPLLPPVKVTSVQTIAQYYQRIRDSLQEKIYKQYSASFHFLSTFLDIRCFYG